MFTLRGGATPTAELTIPAVPGGVAPFGQGLSILGDFNGDGTGDRGHQRGPLSTVPGAVYVFLGARPSLLGVAYDSALNEPMINAFGTSLARR